MDEQKKKEYYRNEITKLINKIENIRFLKIIYYTVKKEVGG